MADFSKLSLAGGDAYNPGSLSSSFGTPPSSGINGSGLTSGSGFGGLGGTALPSSSNYFSAPNPAFGGPPLQSATVPTSPLTKQPIAGFGSANHTVTTPTPTTLPNGGIASSYGNTITGPTNFSLDTGGTAPSNALGTGTTSSDVMNTRNQYAQYVQGLAQAQQYSPAYLEALQRQQAATNNEASLNAGLYTGTAPGETLAQASGATARGLALNSLNKLSATQAVQLQELQRQGNIAGAKSLADAYAPTTVSPGASLVSPVSGQEQYSGLGGYQAVQGIHTVNNLIQSHADAGILPTDSPVVAAQKVSSSPSFQAANLIAYATPSGGIGYINKLQVNQLQRNTDGTYQLIGDAQASSQAAAKSAVGKLTTERADTAAAINAADANFPLLLSAVQKAGLNNNAPFLNELQQAVARKTATAESVAALNTLIPSLQTEYSRIIARGGTVDDKTRSSAAAIVNGTYTFKQLQTVYNTVQKEGQNILKGYDEEIKRQNASFSSPSAGAGGSGVFNF